ncbi:phosphotransferase [Catenuloplanes japonicus]|uniref:phosphotransferase n=1 Tax=Catenuloplanes japonicus TaxID=33876 RepID=UPI00068B7B2A|nr:phosphotransferase [Catenuloplanes japonicus]
MFAEPPGFDRAVLADALRAGWGIEAVTLDYAPVGFGTHHYRARDVTGTEWFVNVDLGADADALDRALRAAAALGESGLEFVAAPLRRADGSCVTVTAEGDAVSVVGVIDGTPHEFGELPSGPVRLAVLGALGRIHAARGIDAPVDTLAVPHRAELAEARGALDRPWDDGPYSGRTSEIVSLKGLVIDELFARYDALVPAVHATRDAWVVTHGEPHAGNVMIPAGGGVRLIDWDTAAIGPRERDLWMLAPRDVAEQAAYGSYRPDEDTMALYRLRWALSEICVFVHELRGPHRDDENTRVAWRELSGYLTADL